MRKNKLLALLLAGTMVAGAAVAFTGCNNTDDPNKPTPGGKAEAITVWVSETEGVKTLTDTQVAKFIADNNYTGKFNVTVQGKSESEAATDMATDVATGADVYCFAQDQMARLIEAKALSKLGTTSAKFVQDNNDAGAVKASTVGTSVYCYPITSDNGYFMYYDKSVVKETSVGDLASIVADCEAANKNFTFALGKSAWYNASFFFGAGCTSAWTFNVETNKWKAADDYNSEKGLIALKGMQILTKSKCYNNTEAGASEFNAATPSAVVISGTWDAAKADEILGENLGVAKLPSYKVDGKSYQLGSFSGYKLMGVKPQTSTERTEFCHKLAQYLSGEECQQARLEQFSWGPSNKVAAASETAQNNLALKGLAAQAPYSTPQGQIHGGWWDLAKGLGENGDLDENGLKDLLKTYQAGIDRFEQMSVDAMNAFGIIGSIASLADTTENLAEGQEVWKDWNTDVAMVKSEGADGATIWTTKVPVVLKTTDRFKFRQGQDWNVQFGGAQNDEGKDYQTYTAGTEYDAKGKVGSVEGCNIAVSADGTYNIIITVAKDVKSAKIKLVAAN